MDTLLGELVVLEQSALDRWTQLDPEGYLDLQAAEVTCFDPCIDKRVDGRGALWARTAPGHNAQSSMCFNGARGRSRRLPRRGCRRDHHGCRRRIWRLGADFERIVAGSGRREFEIDRDTRRGDHPRRLCDLLIGWKILPVARELAPRGASRRTA